MRFRLYQPQTVTLITYQKNDMRIKCEICFEIGIATFVDATVWHLDTKRIIVQDHWICYKLHKQGAFCEIFKIYFKLNTL